MPLEHTDPTGSRRLASRSESLGFAQRTLKNLQRIERASVAGDDVHVVTQRVTSLLGLIVFPWAHGFDDSIKSRRLADLVAQGWPAWEQLLGGTDTLGDLVYHLRNAVSHRRLQFSSDSPNPREVEIEFADAKNDNAPPYWRAKIDAEALYDFCLRFIALVDNEAS